MEGLTIDDYWARVKRLGLHCMGPPHTFSTATGHVQYVPNPERYTPEQRAEIIEHITRLLGVERGED